MDTSEGPLTPASMTVGLGQVTVEMGMAVWLQPQNMEAGEKPENECMAVPEQGVSEG